MPQIRSDHRPTRPGRARRGLTAGSLLALAAALATLAPAAPAAAQGPLDVRAGLAIGPGSLPAALRSRLLEPHTMAWGATAELRLTVGRVGLFSLEGRGTLHTGPRHITVAHPNEPDPFPVYTIVWERPTVQVGPQASWDVRLRADPTPGATFTLGGGLMTEGVRFVAGSTGHRWRDGRLGVDLEVAAYEIRWARSELDLLATDADVTESSALTFGDFTTSYDRRWHPALGLRFSYTLDVLGALAGLSRD